MTIETGEHKIRLTTPYGLQQSYFDNFVTPLYKAFIGMFDSQDLILRQVDKFHEVLKISSDDVDRLFYNQKYRLMLPAPTRYAASENRFAIF